MLIFITTFSAIIIFSGNIAIIFFSSASTAIPFLPSGLLLRFIISFPFIAEFEGPFIIHTFSTLNLFELFIIRLIKKLS